LKKTTGEYGSTAIWIKQVFQLLLEATARLKPIRGCGVPFVVVIPQKRHRLRFTGFGSLQIFCVLSELCFS